jgi:uncharacterized membrane protein (UPF0136 family)
MNNKRFLGCFFLITAGFSVGYFQYPNLVGLLGGLVFGITGFLEVEYN